MVFGDSHCKYFGITPKIRNRSDFIKNSKVDLEIFVKPGATVLGLGRKRSKLNFGDEIKSLISEKPADFFVFCFGQVDVELGYYYKNVVKKEEVDFFDFKSELVDQYVGFIHELNLDKDKVVIKGINLPVLKHQSFAINYTSKIISENIDDDNLKNEMKEKLKFFMPSYAKRSNLTNTFNDDLKKNCLINGWKYFDINNELSSFEPNSGVDDVFIPTGVDHHVADTIYIRKVHIIKLLESVFGK